ncbi:MAG: hypothetical protein EXR72_08380 [Myxococcales bacterium]|nr:hypothetical protein [Myxococcales bacterium]
MDPLHLVHLVLIGLWGGLVLAESVIELGGSDEGMLRAAARLHYWTDLLFEVPILLGVLVTGAWLSARSWPLTQLHYIKIGAALIAIAGNLYAAALVIARRRHLDDLAALRVYRRRIRRTGAALPFALLALYLGLRYFVH